MSKRDRLARAVRAETEHGEAYAIETDQPSSVPSHRYPSGVCAIDDTALTGRPTWVCHVSNTYCETRFCGSSAKALPASSWPTSRTRAIQETREIEGRHLMARAARAYTTSASASHPALGSGADASALGREPTCCIRLALIPEGRGPACCVSYVPAFVDDPVMTVFHDFPSIDISHVIV